MAAPCYFVKALLRVASKNGRDALENIILGQFTSTLDEGNGMRLISTSVNGKSVSFSADPELGTSGLMAKVEEALETFDGLGADAVAALLSQAPVTRARAQFFC